MNESTYNERTTLSAWPSQDVDLLYEKISKVGCGTYGYPPLFTAFSIY